VVASGPFSYLKEPIMGRSLPDTDPTSDRYPYDTDFFAEKYGLSRHAAEIILHSNGPSRDKCDHAAGAFVQAMNLRQMRQKPPAPNIKS